MGAVQSSEDRETAGYDGQYEPFKKTTMFDGTTQHPEWLDEVAVRQVKIVGQLAHAYGK